MSSSFEVFVKKPISKLCRLLKMSRPSHSSISIPAADRQNSSVVSPKQTDVDSYAALIINTIKAAEDPQAAMKDNYIVSITQHKCTRSPSKHEAVYVEFRVVGEDDTHFLCIERMRGKTNPESLEKTEKKGSLLKNQLERLKAALTLAKDDPSLNASNNTAGPSSRLGGESSTSFLDSASMKSVESLNSISGLSSSICSADDRVAACNAIRTDGVTLIKLNMRPESLTLLHIAIMAKVVRAQDPIYTLFGSQCYWYASLLTRLIMQEPGCIPHLVEDTIDTDLLLVSGETLNGNQDNRQSYSPTLAGRWQKIKINEVRNGMVEDVRKVYGQELQRFMEQV